MSQRMRKITGKTSANRAWHGLMLPETSYAPRSAFTYGNRETTTGGNALQVRIASVRWISPHSDPQGRARRITAFAPNVESGQKKPKWPPPFRIGEFDFCLAAGISTPVVFLDLAGGKTGRGWCAKAACVQLTRGQHRPRDVWDKTRFTWRRAQNPEKERGDRKQAVAPAKKTQPERGGRLVPTA